MLARPKGWQGGREGGCRGTPCLPCPTMALARSALGAWGQSELHVLCPQLQATSPASGEKAPGSPSPGGAGGTGKGWGTPRTLPVPPCPAAMVLHPWPHALVPAEPGKLRTGKARVSSGGFGSLWTPLLTAPLLPTARQARGSPQRPLCHAFLPRQGTRWSKINSPVMGCFPTQRSTCVAVIRCLDLAWLLGRPRWVRSRVPAKTSRPALCLNPATLPTAPLPAAAQPGHPQRPKTFTFTTPGILPTISAGPGRASCLGAQLLVPCTDRLGQDGSIYASGGRHK